jgi:hypothetical protein
MGDEQNHVLTSIPREKKSPQILNHAIESELKEMWGFNPYIIKTTATSIQRVSTPITVVCKNCDRELYATFQALEEMHERGYYCSYCKAGFNPMYRNILPSDFQEENEKYKPLLNGEYLIMPAIEECHSFQPYNYITLDVGRKVRLEHIECRSQFWATPSMLFENITYTDKYTGDLIQMPYCPKCNTLFLEEGINYGGERLVKIITARWVSEKKEFPYIFDEADIYRYKGLDYPFVIRCKYCGKKFSEKPNNLFTFNYTSRCPHCGGKAPNDSAEKAIQEVNMTNDKDVVESIVEESTVVERKHPSEEHHTQNAYEEPLGATLVKPVEVTEQTPPPESEGPKPKPSPVVEQYTEPPPKEEKEVKAATTNKDTTKKVENPAFPRSFSKVPIPKGESVKVSAKPKPVPHPTAPHVSSNIAPSKPYQPKKDDVKEFQDIVLESEEEIFASLNEIEADMYGSPTQEFEESLDLSDVPLKYRHDYSESVQEYRNAGYSIADAVDEANLDLWVTITIDERINTDQFKAKGLEDTFISLLWPELRKEGPHGDIYRAVERATSKLTNDTKGIAPAGPSQRSASHPDVERINAAGDRFVTKLVELGWAEQTAIAHFTQYVRDCRANNVGIDEIIRRLGGILKTEEIYAYIHQECGPHIKALMYFKNISDTEAIDLLMRNIQEVLKPNMTVAEAGEITKYNLEQATKLVDVKNLWIYDRYIYERTRDIIGVMIYQQKANERESFEIVMKNVAKALETNPNIGIDEAIDMVIEAFNTMTPPKRDPLISSIVKTPHVAKEAVGVRSRTIPGGKAITTSRPPVTRSVQNRTKSSATPTSPHIPKTYAVDDDLAAILGSE